MQELLFLPTVDETADTRCDERNLTQLGGGGGGGALMTNLEPEIKWIEGERTDAMIFVICNKFVDGGFWI